MSYDKNPQELKKYGFSLSKALSENFKNFKTVFELTHFSQIESQCNVAKTQLQSREKDKTDKSQGK